MKKCVAPIVAVLLVICLFAGVFSGCGKGNGEITYQGDYSEYGNSDNGENVSNGTTPTVVYALTTKEGETVAPVSTTTKLAEFATGDDIVVDVPEISTTYISAMESYTYSTTPDYTGSVISPSTQPAATTQYAAPQTSVVAPTAQATTSKTTTTAEKTTESQVKYISVNASDTDCGGSLDNGLYVDIDMSVFADNTNSLTIKATTGTAILSYGDGAGSCKVKYAVSATPLENSSGQQLHIALTVSSKETKNAIADVGGLVYVTFDKGAIQVNDSKGRIYSNKAFTSAPNSI